MPEGVETEVVRRSLERVVGPAAFDSVWVSGLALRGRAPTVEELSPLVGPPVCRFVRHGKRLGWIQEEGLGAAVRLGMTGRLLRAPRSSPRPKHTHVVFGLAGTDDELRFVDPRRFGDLRFGPPPERPDEGPDILQLDDEDLAEAVVAKLGKTKRTLKDALLDQRVIAGVGNIYACEALFAARLPPRLRGVRSTRAQRRRLVQAVLDEARRGLAHGGTSFRDFVDVEGQPGRHQEHLRVFLQTGRPCVECGRAIERVTAGGRSTFFCPSCQRR